MTGCRANITVEPPAGPTLETDTPPTHSITPPHNDPDKQQPAPCGRECQQHSTPLLYTRTPQYATNHGRETRCAIPDTLFAHPSTSSETSQLGLQVYRGSYQVANSSRQLLPALAAKRVRHSTALYSTVQLQVVGDP